MEFFSEEEIKEMEEVEEHVHLQWWDIPNSQIIDEAQDQVEDPVHTKKIYIEYFKMMETYYMVNPFLVYFFG